MKRKRKRSRKFHGTRSHGTGNTKNKRGKGSKGGWGRAGMQKHRFTYITRYEPNYFGVQGFSPLPKAKIRTINLFQIDQLAQKGKLKEREGKDYFEFDGKVLGTGQITAPVTVKAQSFSKGAAEKIKKAGGAAETFAKKPEKQPEKPKQEKPAENKPAPKPGDK